MRERAEAVILWLEEPVRVATFFFISYVIDVAEACSSDESAAVKALSHPGHSLVYARSNDVNDHVPRN
jgi:hypothetical protein